MIIYCYCISKLPCWTGTLCLFWFCYCCYTYSNIFFILFLVNFCPNKHHHCVFLIQIPLSQPCFSDISERACWRWCEVQSVSVIRALKDRTLSPRRPDQRLRPLAQPRNLPFICLLYCSPPSVKYPSWTAVKHQTETCF